MAASGRRRYGAWLFMAAVIIALLALANAKVFSIKHIEINSKGTLVYTEPQIMEMAGVSIGDSIFTVNKKKVQARLDKDPAITVEDISYVYPDRLYITVIHHGPVARIDHLGQWITVDKDGMALSLAADAGAAGELIEIRGLAVRAVCQGDRLSVEDPAVLDALCRILAYIQEYDLNDALAYIDVANTDNIWIGVQDGCRARLGPAVKEKEKLRWLTSTDIQAQCRQDPAGTLILSVESARFEPSKDENDETIQGE